MPFPILATWTTPDRWFKAELARHEDGSHRLHCYFYVIDDFQYGPPEGYWSMGRIALVDEESAYGVALEEANSCMQIRKRITSDRPLLALQKVDVALPPEIGPPNPSESK